VTNDVFGGFGFTGPHPGSDVPLQVAPTTTDQFNTLKLQLIPIACWRLNRAVFHFDSSFVRPEAAGELGRLKSLVEANPEAPASVFGHADPSGDDDYNKVLSGRRARAIYALLIRDVAAWEELFSSPHGGDTWGLSSTQLMLQHVRNADQEPYYAGSVDGKFGPLTDRAIRRFQTDNGLKVDGIAGPNTRKQLYRMYMDAICVAPNEQFVMTPEQFVGGGQDPEGKAAVQGCSEFNPIVIFSQQQESEFKKTSDKTERDVLNAPNRRVMIFLFRPGLPVTPDEWPCPRVKEGVAGCKAQFYPDGDQRRKPAAEQRTYERDRRTMACRFYDRFAHASPCEGAAIAILSKLFWLTEAPEDQEVNPALVIQDQQGSELKRMPMERICTGPGNCHTFDISDAPGMSPCLLELHDQNDVLAPIMRLKAGEIRVRLASGISQGMRAVLTPDKTAELGPPLDGAEPVPEVEQETPPRMPPPFQP
jgi:outer membrane protein OmpA-like peptidoglycan-associated protein